MICTSTSGTTISSTERPNMVCGKSRLITLFWRISSIPGARPGAVSAAAGLGVWSSVASLGLKRITGAAHGLQISRISRIGLDLAPQPRHLHIDIADIPAELGGLRQVLARDGLAGMRRQARQERRL